MALVAAAAAIASLWVLLSVGAGLYGHSYYATTARGFDLRSDRVYPQPPPGGIYPQPGIFSVLNVTLSCNATGQTTGKIQASGGYLFGPGTYLFNVLESADAIGNFSTAWWMICNTVGTTPTALPVNTFLPPIPPYNFLANSYWGEMLTGAVIQQQHYIPLQEQPALWCDFQWMCQSGGGAVDVFSILQISFQPGASATAPKK